MWATRIPDDAARGSARRSRRLISGGRPSRAPRLLVQPGARRVSAPDEPAFKLGRGGDTWATNMPAGESGTRPTSQRDDAARKPLQDPRGVGHGAREPVEPRHDDDVDLAALDSSERAREAGAGPCVRRRRCPPRSRQVPSHAVRRLPRSPRFVRRARVRSLAARLWTRAGIRSLSSLAVVSEEMGAADSSPEPVA